MLLEHNLSLQISTNEKCKLLKRSLNQEIVLFNGSVLTENGVYS